ncbi:MAG: class IV adenylate cyclase [Candidatus Korarchaeota archaeon]
MIEVEVKAKIDDVEKIHRIINTIGAEFISRETQEDIYFCSQNHDFLERDDALRIRITKNGTYITYKGPKIDTETKTREEIEVEIDDPHKTIKIFERLGFEVFAVVRKMREKYRYNNLTIAIDNVEGLGYFIEIEKQNNGNNVDYDKKKIIELLEKLGISKEKMIRKSYLELLYTQEAPLSV